MNFELSEAQRALIERVDGLVRERIAPRAEGYDQTPEVPVEDLKDLHREGWLLANLPRRYGGLGYGLEGDDPLAFFLMIEHLAYGNPSTAHCFQVHNNTLMMLSATATDSQRQRWVEPTVRRGALLPGAGTSPHGVPPTAAQTVQGGYILTGLKHYATNAPVAEWFWVASVRIEGEQRPSVFMVRRDAPGVRIDSEIWQPMGMRACVSPWLHLENCFVPEEDRLVQAREASPQNWLGKINFAFTANYIGSAQFIYDWSVRYVRERGQGGDASRQLRVGEMKSMLDASRLLLYHTVALFKRDQERAMLMAHEAKWLAKEALRSIMWWAGEVCSSTSLFRKYPLERFFRDMHVHMLHGYHDTPAQVVGAAELGEPYDITKVR
jgi:alkylation response protein AidB-like acyl-CoA dehydrogenase